MDAASEPLCRQRPPPIFTGVTILISLPTGTKIFNWLFTYLGNPPLLHLRISSVFFSHLFLLMFTIGGSTGIILGNAAVDLGLHDTYYVVAHFHFVLSLGAIISIFSGIIFNGEKIVGTKNLLFSSSSTLSLFHLHLIFIGILLTFSPMHFLGFNVMRRPTRARVLVLLELPIEGPGDPTDGLEVPLRELLAGNQPPAPSRP